MENMLELYRVLFTKLAFVTSLKTLSKVFNFFGLYFFEKSQLLTPPAFFDFSFSVPWGRAGGSVKAKIISSWALAFSSQEIFLGYLGGSVA